MTKSVKVSSATHGALIREARERDTTVQDVADELIGEVLVVSPDDESKVEEEEEDLPESEDKK